MVIRDWPIPVLLSIGKPSDWWVNCKVGFCTPLCCHIVFDVLVEQLSPRGRMNFPGLYCRHQKVGGVMPGSFSILSWSSALSSHLNWVSRDVLLLWADQQRQIANVSLNPPLNPTLRTSEISADLQVMNSDAFSCVLLGPGKLLTSHFFFCN